MLQRPTQLSIGDLNYNTLPRPGKGSFRRSLALSPGENSRISRFYSTLPSQDDICLPERSSQDSTHRASSFELQRPTNVPSPSAQCKRKVPTLSISGTCVGSPMSVITETTEPKQSPGPAVVLVPNSRATSYTFPDAVELPTEITPTRTPEKVSEIQPLHHPTQQSYQGMHDSIDETVSILSSPPRLTLQDAERNDSNLTIKTRSVSLGSLASPGPPPEIELPQLPPDAARLPRTSLRRSRTSHYGQDKTIHTVITIPSTVGQHLTTPSDASAFQGFTFGFNRSSTIQERPVQDNTTPDLSKLAAPRYRPPLTIDVQAAQAGSGLKTIDQVIKVIEPSVEAIPATPTFPSQVYKRDSRFASPWNYELFISSPTRSLKDDPDRRTSISSVENSRRSVTSPTTTNSPGNPQKRGHRRQNCVRISGLAPMTAKQRLSQQLNRLSIREDELEDATTPNFRPVELEARRIESAQSSIMNSPGTSSPALPSSQGRSNMSLRVRGPRLVINRIPSTESTPTASSRIITPPKLQQNMTVKIPGQDGASPRLPLAESAVHSIRMNSTPSPQSTGDTPSPFKLSPYKYSPMLASPSRQKSKIGGPRTQSSSKKVENSASPLRAKSTSVTSSVKVPSTQSVPPRGNSSDEDDLQKSINMLKSLKLGLIKEMTCQSSEPTAGATSNTPVPKVYGSISPPKMRKRSSTVVGHRHESQSESGRARLKQAQEEYQVYLNDRNFDGNIPPTLMVSNSNAIAGSTTKSSQDLSTSPSSLSIWEDQSIREDSPDTTNRSTRQSSPERVLRKHRLEASKRKVSNLNLNIAFPKPLQIQARREVLRERIDAFESTAARFVSTTNSGPSPIKSRSPLSKISDNPIKSSPSALASSRDFQSAESLSIFPVALDAKELKDTVTTDREVEPETGSANAESPQRGRRNHTPNLAQLRLEIDRQRLHSATREPRLYGQATKTQVKPRSMTDTKAQKIGGEAFTVQKQMASTSPGETGIEGPVAVGGRTGE